jgi:hypothetical protein
MTLDAREFPARNLSRDTFGVGGTMLAAFNDGVVRVLAETSGAGGITFITKAFGLCFDDEVNSGDGGTTPIEGKAGATREERKPSAGGGPGFALNARRLATAESERGRLILGASTTFSAGLSPRATRMTWVRW